MGIVVSEFMTHRPEIIEASISIRDAIRKMHDMDIRHLPVLDAEGQLVGIVSDRDVRHLIVLPGEDVVANEKVIAELEAPVSQIMSGDVISVNTEADISDVVELMLENKIGAVPVVDENTGKLKGIVSYIDVLNALRETL